MSKPESHGFETSQDPAVRSLFAQWIKPLTLNSHKTSHSSLFWVSYEEPGVSILEKINFVTMGLYCDYIQLSTNNPIQRKKNTKLTWKNSDIYECFSVFSLSGDCYFKNIQANDKLKNKTKHITWAKAHLSCMTLLITYLNDFLMLQKLNV